MDLSDEARRGRGARRGFTMIELLLAAICTAAVMMACTTMVLAVSNVTQSSDSQSIAAVQGHGAARRVSKKLREARLIGFHDATRLTLWATDSNSNDQIELSETGLLWWDQFAYKLNWTQPSAADASNHRNVPITEFRSSGFPATIQSAPQADTTVLATEVTNAAIATNAAADGAQIADVDFRIRSNGTQFTDFSAAASPRAPADYLTDSSSNTTDGGVTTRPRRLLGRAWNVPSGHVTEVTVD